jgi:hypothetical protein
LNFEAFHFQLGNSLLYLNSITILSKYHCEALSVFFWWCCLIHTWKHIQEVYKCKFCSCDHISIYSGTILINNSESNDFKKNILQKWKYTWIFNISIYGSFIINASRRCILLFYQFICPLCQAELSRAIGRNTTQGKS